MRRPTGNGPVSLHPSTFRILTREPYETIGEQEEFTFAWRLAPFDLEETAAFQECTAGTYELKWKIWCGFLQGEKGEGLRMGVERGVERLCN